MQISNMIPAKVQTAYAATKEFCSRLPNKIQTFATSIFENLLQKFEIKTWFDTTIKPLTKTDYLILVTSIALAAFCVFISVTQFGIATLPLAFCGGAIIVGCSGLIIQKRLRQHFSRIASGHLKKMEEEAKKISNRNQNFVMLQRQLFELKKPEFSHLADTFKNLEDQTKTFQKTATKPTIKDQKDILKAHLDSIQTNIPQDQDILKNLRQQIDAVGTDKQNLVELETQKQKLRQLQSQPALSHQAELSKQTDKLSKIAQKTNFLKIREAYLGQLQGLQKNIA